VPLPVPVPHFLFRRSVVPSFLRATDCDGTTERRNDDEQGTTNTLGPTAPDWTKAARTSPTKYSEPATTTQPPSCAARASAAASASATTGTTAHGKPGLDGSSARSSSGARARVELLGRVSVRLATCGASAAIIGAASLSPSTANTRCSGRPKRARSCVSARTRASTPCALWAPSSSSGGRPARAKTSMRPGQRVCVSAWWTSSSPSVGSTQSAAAVASAAFLAWWGPSSDSVSGPKRRAPTPSCTCPSSSTSARSSRPRRKSGAPTRAASASITCAACSGASTTTAGRPGRSTAALSRAMAASVSPKIWVCSSVSSVSTEATASTARVASFLAPMPASITATSTPSSASATRPAAVMTSKNVSSPKSGATRSTASNAAIRRAPSISWGTASVTTCTRSVSEMRCGEVYRPTRRPRRDNSAARNADVEPLPLLPATCTAAKLRSGWPSAASTGESRSRPSTMPRRERASRRSTSRAQAGPSSVRARPGPSMRDQEAMRRMSVAILGRSSRRGTIMSITPCSSRNSERWKPSGSF
jgi:hypothetical protein